MRRGLLSTWLERHVGADDTEREHVATVLRALRAPPDPFDRRTFTPGHVTASGFVVSPDGGELLLIHHRTLDRWLQPGGHVEAGDADVVAAARREVAEETGVVDVASLAGFPFLLDVDVHAIPDNPRRGEPAHLHLDARVLFRARDRTLRPSGEVAAARWVPLDEVGALGADASVLRAVARLRARLAGPAALWPTGAWPDGAGGDAP